ncbi:MAG: GTPase Era [Spirochaetes bacterium]|nr:GTPase Era [Spirochaetota bacterium]
MNEQTYKSGFVALIGRPSSGKSTLINQICGYKISIVSHHPQTTRFIVRGIYSEPNYQAVFIDTPGYHKFNSLLNKGLTSQAVKTLQDGDLILYLVDASREFGQEEMEIIEKVNQLNKKVICVFNKMDVKVIATTIQQVKEKIKAADFCQISATTGANIDQLKKKILALLPEGPQYYPEDYVTDQNIPFRITEVVREKIFNLTHQEIPHSVYVKIDDLKINEKKIICHASIFVERDSQKGLIIGNQGKAIKKIGEEARKELMDILETKLELYLKVRVHKNWKKDERFLKNLFKQNE